MGRWGGQFNGAACEMHAVPEKCGGGGEMRQGKIPPCASSPCLPASRPPHPPRPRVPSSPLPIVPASSPRVVSSPRHLVRVSPCPCRRPLWGGVEAWRGRCGQWRVVLVLVWFRSWWCLRSRGGHGGRG